MVNFMEFYNARELYPSLYYIHQMKFNHMMTTKKEGLMTPSFSDSFAYEKVVYIRLNTLVFAVCVVDIKSYG